MLSEKVQKPEEENLRSIKNRKCWSAENKSYNLLVEHGYSPQGVVNKSVCVMKIENKHKSDEKIEIYYFKNWQEAAKTLLPEFREE